MDAGLIAGAVAAALVAIVSGIVFPLFKWMRKDLQEVRKEVAECEKERLEAAKWRAQHEKRISQIENVSVIGRVTARANGSGEMFVISANPAMQVMFGYSLKEFVDMAVTELIAPRDREKHRKAVLELGSLELVSDSYYKRINGGTAVCKDGHTFPVRVEIEVVLEQGKRVWAAAIQREL